MPIASGSVFADDKQTSKIAKMALSKPADVNPGPVSRFNLVNEDGLQDILAQADSVNTKKQIQFALNVFEEYLKATNRTLSDAEGLSNLELDGILLLFYVSARSRDGSLYSKKSMQGIRFGLQRHFLRVKLVDIINHKDFSNSGRTFKSMLVTLKKQGKAVTKHKTPISEQDMATIQDSFDLNSPEDLQDKVFIDIMLFFCNRGRENLREMTPNQFEEHFQNGKCIITKRDTLTKNNREDHDEASQCGVMVEIPGNPRCPVASLRKYKQKLNPDCDSLWQRPKTSVSDDDDVWYCNISQGKNTLGDKMKKISMRAGCSQVYTNHCLRATSVTILDHAGFKSRDIMTVSGHHAESSIKNYVRTSEATKVEMSNALANIVAPTEIPSTSAAASSTASECVDLPLQLINVDNELLMVDEILRDITNSSPSRPLNINATSQVEKNKQTQFQFHNCVVNIYNQ